MRIRLLLLAALLLIPGCQTDQKTVQQSKTRAALAKARQNALIPLPLPPTQGVSRARQTFTPDGNPTPLTVNWSLEWDPSPSLEVVAYRVYYGPLPRTYTNASIVVGGTTAVIPVNVLLPWFYSVTAINTNGLESDFSEEINFATLNGAGIAWQLPTNKQPTAFSVQLSTNLQTWQAITAPFVFNQPNAFYRLRVQ